MTEYTTPYAGIPDSVLHMSGRIAQDEYGLDDPTTATDFHEKSTEKGISVQHHKEH